MQEVQNSTSGSINGAPSTPASTARRPEIAKVLPMAKGEAHDSYTKNSTFQEFIVRELALPEVDKALDQLSLPSHGPVVVAELGCSSGQNAITSVTHILEKLRARFSDPASPSTEFQVFFNDLPSNDFNNLFQRLSSHCGGKHSFFMGGVPGSFYGRLFPRSSVHVFFSAMSVHWLSKIPDAVRDENSPAFNKGRSSVHGSSVMTTTAYKEQAAADLKEFLTARAAELVPGGLLFFLVTGRRNPDVQRSLDVDDPMNVWWEIMDEVWDQLTSQVENVGDGLEDKLISVYGSATCVVCSILQGILTHEQRDTFYIPLYYRSIDEVLEAVESCGSAFHVQTTKYLKLDANYDRIFLTSDPGVVAKKITHLHKSIISNVVESHIGQNGAKAFWLHFEPMMEKKALANTRRIE